MFTFKWKQNVHLSFWTCVDEEFGTSYSGCERTAHDELNKCNKLKASEFGRVRANERVSQNENEQRNGMKFTVFDSTGSSYVTDSQSALNHKDNNIRCLFIGFLPCLNWRCHITHHRRRHRPPHRRCRRSRNETRKTVWINRHQDRKMCAWHLICTDELPASITQYSYNLFKQTANCRIVTVWVFFRDFSHINRSQINMFCTHRWTSESARLSCK